MQMDSIVILDFGGQYAHLIGSRVRRLGAFSQILPPETPAKQLKDAAGIILSGGPQSVYDKGSPQADPGLFALGIPILGICYGHQWIAHALKGEVKPGKTKEYGRTVVRKSPIPNPQSPILFEGVPDAFTVWMSHGDAVTKLPPRFSPIASSDDCPVAGMADLERRIFGVQFHLEVTHTEHGLTILRNFIELCHPAPWSVSSYRDRIAEELRKQVGDDRHVFMLVSGGVDSTVAFTLLNEVLGHRRVQGLLVDTGLMRKREVALMQEAFQALGISNLRVVDASSEFFPALHGVTEPEHKRQVIGATFLAVQKRVSEEMGLTPEAGWMLGQGTIYPDTIEAGGTKHADTIKTHHNRVEAIQKMIDAGLVVEPLKDLYKDEVRMLGEELGLPHDVVWRHPFPGPGLGVRILCVAEDAEQRTESRETMSDLGIPSAILPVRSVGVQGDGRTYRHALVLFADKPTAVTDEHRLLATEISNRYRAFNRVLLCTSQSEPATLLTTAGGINRERADLLREADAIADEEVRRAGLYGQIWQFPVVLLPCGIHPGAQSIVLRPIASVDAMTADAFILPPAVLQRMTERIMQLPGIDTVFFDLTSKPPATIEWE
jgi:GMP synthase (glutamine-hydrolysing)